MAERRGAPPRPALLGDLRALLEHGVWIGGEQADQLLAVGPDHIGAAERALADKILLGGADHAGKPEIVEGHRAVGLLPDDEVAFLGTQHMHGLGAVWCNAVRLPGRPDRLPDRSAEIRR